MGLLYNEVRKLKVLEAAWKKVRQKGLMSASNEIRAEVLEFDKSPSSHLHSISGKLSKNSFKFTPQTGIAKKRLGKSSWPLVVAPLHNRIVQRAILNVLNEIPVVREVRSVITSVGGIDGRDQAIAQVTEAIKSGKVWYVRSDIPGFFTKIPRENVLTFIRQNTDDSEFCALFEKAMETELANVDVLGKEAELFPTGEHGVAQGSSLSPLIGNILLRNFDAVMNDRGIVCIRYIDDFILLAEKGANALKAFNSALVILKEMGLDAYDPMTCPEKAGLGHVEGGFDFLGCRITGNMVQPSESARNRLVEKVENILSEGCERIKYHENDRKSGGASYAQTLCSLDRVLKGWGDSFSFCNDRRSFLKLDKRIDKLLSRFHLYVRKIRSKCSPVEKRRILGVHALCDTQQIELTVKPRTI